MTLLDRPTSPEDIEAERDQPRPGVWAGEPGADLRALTQDETDALIRAELVRVADIVEKDAIDGACGGPLAVRMTSGILVSIARTQRGGIDSDPLVRVLARRAWGDRDRQWFELRGVRKGEAVAKMMSGAVALAWPGDRTRNADIMLGRAMHDARTGEEVEVVGVDVVTSAEFANGKPRNYGTYYVSDRLREPPVGYAARVAQAHEVWVMLEEQAQRTMDAATLGLSVASVIERIDRLTGDPPTAMPMSAAMAERIRTELATKRADDVVAPSHAPGARKPGHKPAPPVPRWAKKRRERSQ